MGKTNNSLWLSLRFNGLKNVVFVNQVAPAELEALLNTHHSIQDAAVIGLKKGEDVGEVPKAFVVLKPDTDVKPSDIQEFVESKTTE